MHPMWPLHSAHPLPIHKIHGVQQQRGGVAHQGDAVSGGQRLQRQQGRGVEEPTDGVRLQHSYLREHLVEHLIGQPVLRVLAHLFAAAAGQHRHHRLASGQPPHDSGELARVAQALDVQQHYGCRVVGLPVLQQVVAGDVHAHAG